MSLNKFGKRKKKNELDKFYTKPQVAIGLISTLNRLYPFERFDTLLEPSAGSGSFLLNLPKDKRLGIDLEPAHQEIIKSDFLDWTPDLSKRYMVVGNPPFGRVSSLAVRFFEKSAEFADVIAFIIPRTFRRVSIQNRLNLNFHLVYDEELPLRPCCFEPKMSAKCCFQIWEKRKEKREIISLNKSHDDWRFLPLGPKDNNGQPTPPPNADFALKAYGSNCGQIVTENLHNLRPKSWHWISTKDPALLIEKLKVLDYSISKDTARQDSIGRAELVHLYEKRYNK
jgi:hypothetical protein